MKPDDDRSRRLLVFTKPAIPGRVKTRLTRALDPETAARLHQAMLDDLLDRLADAPFGVTLAWALEGDETPPELLGRSFPSVRQTGADLGERLWRGLADAADAADAAGEAAVVMAVGSDHPTVSLQVLTEAFERVEAGADVALGPSDDGGYYLIAVAAEALSPGLFDGIDWSTERVIRQTIDNLAAARLTVALLPPGRDLDTPGDLERFSRDLASGAVDGALCPRTVALLESLGQEVAP